MGSTNVKQRGTTPSPAVRARILRGLRRGDQTYIAEVVGTVPEYVKQVLRYRPGAKSALASRIWHAADRLVRDRAKFNNDLKP